MSWAEVAGAVRKLATRMRALGLGKGDRVVAYMPNIPETVVAMLATTAIGAVWSSAAPEFGAQTVIDRFGQIEPKLVFAANGYRYAGKDFDRIADLKKIVGALPTAKHLVMLDYHPDAAKTLNYAGAILRWQEMLEGTTSMRARSPSSAWLRSSAMDSFFFRYHRPAETDRPWPSRHCPGALQVGSFSFRTRPGRCAVFLLHDWLDGLEYPDVGAAHEWRRGPLRRASELPGQPATFQNCGRFRRYDHRCQPNSHADHAQSGPRAAQRVRF